MVRGGFDVMLRVFSAGDAESVRLGRELRVKFCFGLKESAVLA